MLTVSRLIFHFFNEKTLLHYAILYGINIFHNLSNFRCLKCNGVNILACHILEHYQMPRTALMYIGKILVLIK